MGSGVRIDGGDKTSSEKGRGIKALQEKVKTAASTYLTQGNAAIDKDWEEF
jgi:methyl-accepting chemotaxis protein